ncbi:MAG TPA: hypothetical protein VFU90_02340 [Candidatus Tumulicola sp.]|nr:hypothetical protein [Candidatus Tumulicola sp.]HSC31048.1 hypothetical protein [Gemmatimonadaceae bacterium]
MPDLLIRIKRATDGSAALTCVRADGSVTWQRQVGPLGAFFPTHDLTHYAVETTLGYRQGFYGLIADGWEIADFETAKGDIPREAREAELVVGVFEMELRMGRDWSGSELREQGERYASSTRPERARMPLPPLTDDDIARVRALRAAVFAQWEAVGPGDTLELAFSRPT